ncbi:glycoside hydrolase family 18 protein [Alteromonas sediminis]|uniref:chitinase n=1 Tax=Alteromonas sediminis TaxID=2259342 RepID=A0A3N5Y4J7_9ALTE|nr:glycoside hydrolase family 18 protein [Alteromonas sediminis]RPJ68490.1 glycoside hydrolase family 18 protein [Alteromonas sediminis]
MAPERILKALIFTSLFFVSFLHAESEPLDNGRVIIGYVFSEEAVINPNEIAAEKLTHINYAFSNIENHRIVEGFQYDTQNYRVLQTLKKRNPDLKILTSVGGWTWSGKFSDMALTESSRQAFIDSAAAFIKKHQLDGIDIDWEYPGLPGAGNVHRDEDGKNFTLVLKGLRQRLDKLEGELGRPLLLTIASGGFQAFIDQSDIGNWQRYLDFINIMAYDFHVAAKNTSTGHHAGLYTHPNDTRGLSADAAVKAHLAAGVPPEKLVLGVAFYGRSWASVAADNQGLHQRGQPNTAEFNGINYGSNSYHNLFVNVINKNGFTRYWDDIAKAPYLWNQEKRIFVTYDDPESIALKTDYVKNKGLKGVMFWAYDSDHETQLLTTIYQGLRK